MNLTVPAKYHIELEERRCDIHVAFNAPGIEPSPELRNALETVVRETIEAYEYQSRLYHAALDTIYSARRRKEEGVSFQFAPDSPLAARLRGAGYTVNARTPNSFIEVSWEGV